MQGTLFQLLVLVTHGNRILSGQPLAFYPQHAAFIFNEYVKFVMLERTANGWNEQPFAADPNAWLAELQRRQCRGLRVHRLPTDTQGIDERLLVGFIGGGGRWLIEAVMPEGSDYWEAKWEVGDRNRADRRIWRVTYGQIARYQESRPIHAPSVDELSADMTQALQDALAFCARHQLEGFRKIFESAYVALNAASESAVSAMSKSALGAPPEPPPGATSEPPLDGLALPGQLPLPAARLLVAAKRAWVFGGMGSWNDMGFDGDDQRQYEDISERLYRALTAIYVVATNLSYPQQTAPPQD